MGVILVETSRSSNKLEGEGEVPDDDDDVYLIQITTWQWVIKSISILIWTSQNGILMYM
jgi:hypothetical protein